MSEIFRTLCLLLLMVASGHAIKCYVCEYNQFTGGGSTCRGPTVAANYLTMCATGIDKCAVVFHTVSAGPSSFLTIRRQCLNSTNPARCVTSGATQACSCTTDNCNNLATPQPPPPPPPPSSSQPAPTTSSSISISSTSSSATATPSTSSPNQITSTAAQSTTSGGRSNHVGLFTVIVSIACLAVAALA